MRTRSQADIQEIDRLKSLYRAAISRKFSAPGAQDSGPDTEDQKRTQKALKAIELENQAFIERLRRRLVELGVGKGDIQEIFSKLQSLPPLCRMVPGRSWQKPGQPFS